MIDAIAQNKELLDAYKVHYKTYQRNQRERQILLDRHQQNTKEMDFIEYQLEELATADFQIGEQGKLEQELDILENAEEIKISFLE